MTKLKIGVIIFLVFSVGALAGSLGTQVYFKERISHYMKRDHRARAEYFLNRLTEKLDLTEAQQQTIGQILRESHQKIREIDRKFRPEIKKIIDQDFQTIRNELTAVQKPKFDEFVESFRNRHRMKGATPPSSPPRKE